jgi:hypothetical protein
MPAVDPPYPLPMRLAAGWELARRRATAEGVPPASFLQQ